MGDVFAALGLSNDIVLAIAAYALLIVAAFWLAMIVWTFRDMRSRSRDTLSQLGMTLMVALLTVPGLLIYLLLRPRETLGEAYERSLEEEALLQEIEEKPKCPGCGQPVKEMWQACPHCHTRLKKPCLRCGNMLELSWQLCPYCATPQSSYSTDTPPPSRQTRPATIPEDWRVSAASASVKPTARSTEQIEFVEGDEF